MSILMSKYWLFALALSSAPVLAGDYKLKDLVIDHPYARATPPGATTGGAYVTVENKGATSDKLLAASTPAAKSVEIHEMSMNGGMMTMRAVPGIEIKARAKVELKPGGYHLMLLDLKEPLKTGAKIPLTLVFEKAGKVEVSAWVEDMTAGAMHPKH